MAEMNVKSTKVERLWFYFDGTKVDQVTFEVLSQHTQKYFGKLSQYTLPSWVIWIGKVVFRQRNEPNDSFEYFWSSGMNNWETLDKLPIMLALFELETPPKFQSELSTDDPHKSILSAFFSIPKLIQHPRFLVRIIVLLLVEFVLFFSFIGAPFLLCIHRGWRLEYIRINDPSELPSVHPFKWAKYLWDGFLLWLANLYYAIPAVIYVFLTNRTWLFDLWTILKWLGDTLLPFYQSQINAIDIVTIVLEYLITSGILLLYTIVVWPIFRIGMLNYAISGKKSDLFNFIKNTKRVMEQFPACMHLYYQDRIIWLLITPLLMFLAPFTLGLTAIFGEVLRMYVTGHIYKVGRKVLVKHENQK